MTTLTIEEIEKDLQYTVEISTDEKFYMIRGTYKDLILNCDWIKMPIDIHFMFTTQGTKITFDEYLKDIIITKLQQML